MILKGNNFLLKKIKVKFVEKNIDICNFQEILYINLPLQYFLLIQEVQILFSNTNHMSNSKYLLSIFLF